ncbi:hypothetical protein ASG43_06455 [Aureimonas sp. Leaf454]|uniref:AzlD family protein n=1 Tax=Aureimonas sp. Leaf454 TaxID=1736381 RepID=UPI0006F50D87|nr:AzlD domain-containing protein [Aureimonas sp. Leaf454]KQT50893.1 hypothetical protein ASG43_06455 [Aureimonas sp. Leaf454]
MSDIWWIALWGGLLTYVTRVSGHLILTRFERIPPRLEAALNAVPAAVITTIVVPTLVSGAWPERIGIVLAALLSLRFPLIATVGLGTGFVVAARALGF